VGEKGLQEIRENYGSLAILLLLLVASRILQYYLSGFGNDDCYITFRYARNIAAGHGFVYNLGEKVLGTTTPLWAILLSLPTFLSSPAIIPISSVTVSIMADMMTIVALWKIMDEVGIVARYSVVLLFLLHPKVMQICGSGMEASLVVALMVGSFTLFIMGKRTMAALLLGLLLLARFDGAIWVAILLGWIWIQQGKLPWKEALIIAFVMIPWLMFSQLYFGSMVPHSITAKSMSYAHLFPAFDPIRTFTGYLPFESLRSSSVSVRLPIIVLMLVPVSVEVVRLWREKSAFVVWPAFFLLYTLTFSFARVVLHDWYYLPGFVAYFVSCATLAELLFSKAKSARRGLRRWGKVVGSIGLAGYLVLMVLRLGNNVGKPFEFEYGDLARYFQDKSKLSILLEPIGYVGWLSDSYIYDPIGIISPRVLEYQQQYPGSDQWWISYVRASLPDYVVLRMQEVKENRLYLGRGGDLFSGETSKNWFKENYCEVNWPHRTAIHFFVYRKKRSSETDFAATGLGGRFQPY